MLSINEVSKKPSLENFTEEDPLKPNGETTEITNESCCANIKNIFRNVTVEPTMLLMTIGCILTLQTTQNLSLEKSCQVNLNLTNNICSSLKVQTMRAENIFEKDVQQLTAKYLGIRTYIASTIPCILALFAGSYSDKTGKRKLFMIIPIVGQILLCINNSLNVYFFDQLNLQFLTFSEAIIEGFSGGWCILFFTLFAYMSTITSIESRTYRMGILSFCLSVGIPIGMGLSGILLNKTGYYGSYGVAAGLHIVNLIYNVFILKEAPRTPEQKLAHENRSFFSNFFSISNLCDSIRVVFRNGPSHRRARMIIFVMVTCILFGPFYGDISVMYLITRYKFNWDEVSFSIFQCYNFVAHTIGTIFSIIVFSKVLRWHDSVLGIISTSSKIFASFVYCFAPDGRIFYIAPLIDILNGSSLIAMRSILSKIVDPDELGKVNSIVSLAENLTPLVYVPLYTSVYNATRDVLPGAVFLVGAFLILPALLVFTWLFYAQRKDVGKLRT